jgi:DNA-binding MarR family transcriptional regulator
VSGTAKSITHEAEYPATDAGYAGGCTCFYLRSATRRITQVYDEGLKAAGISVNQFSLLSQLSRNAGISVSTFADIMSMDRTTLTRNLQPLQAAGWVVSGNARTGIPGAAGGAGRSRLLSLSDAGHAKLREAIPLWRVAQAKVNEVLGSERQRTLHRTLKESIRTFESQQPLGS